MEGPYFIQLRAELVLVGFVCFLHLLQTQVGLIDVFDELVI